MYTNIVNIPDSILFLTSCRLAIKESVLVSEDINAEDKYGLVDFVMNEASDYQIMNIIVNDEFVEEKYNADLEVDLFDQYKAMVVDNISEFSAVLESEDLKSVLYEIGPISQEGLSSAAPILDFLHETGVLAERRKKTGVVKGIKSGMRGAKSLKKGGAYASTYGDDAATYKAGQAVGRQMKKGKEAAGKAGAAVAKKAGSAKDAAMKGAGAVADTAKSAKDAAAARIKAAKDQAKIGFKKQQMGYKKVGAAQQAGAMAAKAKQAMSTKSGDLSKAKVAGAAALGAAAIYGGVQAYKRFMSQAARACSGKSGGEKDACMKQYRSKGIQSQIAATQRGMGACAKAKNPEKCKAAIQARVAKLKSKMARVNA